MERAIDYLVRIQASHKEDIANLISVQTRHEKDLDGLMEIVQRHAQKTVERFRDVGDMLDALVQVVDDPVRKRHFPQTN